MIKIISVALRLCNCFQTNQEEIISSLPFGISERTRLKSIKNPRAKAESLAALVALKDLTDNTVYTDLTISRTPENKPYFINLQLYFSLSHSNGIAGAVSSSNRVGIDVEYVDSNRDFSNLTNRFFTKDEKRLLASSNNPTFDFYSIWTKKEALSKISGKGLSEISERSSFDCFSHQYKIIYNGDTFILSICTDKKDDDIIINNPYKELTIYELQN